MKKIYWIILIVLVVLGLITLSLFLWTRHTKAELSKKHQNLIEVPSGVDYQNINETKAKTILEATVKKFPKIETDKDQNDKAYPLPQNIIITKDGTAVDNGQTPMQGDVQIEPSGPENGTRAGNAQNQNGVSNEQDKNGADSDQDQNGTDNDNADNATPDNQDNDQDNTGEDQTPALQMPQIMYSGFVYEDTDQQDLIQKLISIKTMVEKYYPEIVKVYNEPYDVKNRTISIVYDSEYDFSGYFPQYDTVYVNDTDAVSVIPDFINSFLGTKSSGYPETWLYGSLYVTFLATSQKFPEDSWASYWLASSMSKDYEKFNVPDYPIWGTNITYQNDIFQFPWSRVVKASAALNKSYLSDNKLFYNLNQQMYQIDFLVWYQQYDTEQLFDKVSSAFPSVEGKSAKEWYKVQHVLHQSETNPVRLINMIHFGQTLAIVLNYDDPSWDVIQVFDYKSSMAGFTPKQSRAISVIISDHKDNTVVSQTYTTSNSGITQKKLNEIGISSDGRYRVHFGNETTYFHFNYFASPDIAKLNGVVVNFGQGKIAAYDQNKTLLEEVPITNGAFQFSKVLSGLLDLKIKDYNGNVVLEKPLIKDAGSYYTYLESPVRSYPSESQTRGGGANCQIDTASWQSYDGGEYTIKYPKDWFSDQESSQEGSTHWFVAFGPNDLAPLVYIGGNATDINQFKNDLISASGQGFQIKKEEKETVSGTEATKLSVEGGPNYPYLTYIYYITLGNVPTIIKGPAESDHFANSCEPAIFAEMVKSYNFRGMGPWTGSENNSDNQTYTDTVCGFSFQYPSDWEIKQNYFYETAGGEKANVPTILLAQKDNEDASKNIIIINPRQSFCMETDSSKKTKEVLLPNSSFVADLVSYPDQNMSCEEATREGKDKNSKTADYHFYSIYDNDSGVKDIFKQVFLSFTVPD